MAGKDLAGNEFYNYVKKWVVNDYKTPGIKAEVIIDMLLSEYVAEIVQNAINEGKEEKDKVVLELVSKEFPIRTLIGDGPDFEVDKSNRSARVDYLLADWKKEKLYFVELKTAKESAKESIGSKQLIRMIYSAYCSNENIFQFYEYVKENSGDSKSKYDAYEASRKSQFTKLEQMFTKLKQMEKPSVECVYLTMGDLFSNSNRKLKNRSIENKIWFKNIHKDHNKILLTIGEKEENEETDQPISVHIVNFGPDLQPALNSNEQSATIVSEDETNERKPSWKDMQVIFKALME